MEGVWGGVLLSVYVSVSIPLWIVEWGEGVLQTINWFLTFILMNAEFLKISCISIGHMCFLPLSNITNYILNVLINQFISNRLTTLKYCGSFCLNIDMNQPKVYMCPSIPNTPPISFPIPFLWVVPVHWLWVPCLLHWIWTGHLFHICIR